MTDYGSITSSPLISRSKRVRTMNSFWLARQTMAKWISEITRQTLYTSCGFWIHLSFAATMLIVQIFLVVYEMSFLMPSTQQIPNWFITLDFFIICYLIGELLLHFAEHDFDWRMFCRAKENQFDVLILIASVFVSAQYLYSRRTGSSNIEITKDREYLAQTDNLTFLGLRIFRDIVWTFRILYFILLLRKTIVLYDTNGGINQITIPKSNSGTWYPEDQYAESDLEENWIGA